MAAWRDVCACLCVSCVFTVDMYTMCLFEQRAKHSEQLQQVVSHLLCVVGSVLISVLISSFQ